MIFKTCNKCAALDIRLIYAAHVHQQFHDAFAALDEVDDFGVWAMVPCMTEDCRSEEYTDVYPNSQPLTRCYGV